RQPCPCGSGRRYKACHGAPGGAQVFVKRPFEGLASECDLVAMRELVPAATATLSLKGEYAGREVKVCTLLPGAAPALVRDSGEVWLGLQVQHSFGDPSRDLAAVLEPALAAEPGAGMVGLTQPPAAGARLQDLVTDEALDVAVHEGFEYWVADMEANSELAQALEQAEGAAAPTARLVGVEAAYWTQMGAKEHLRWVMPEPEDELLTALARLHVAGDDVIVPEARLVGMFRAHGLLAPVWDLPFGTGPEPLEDVAVAFKQKLDAALGDTSDLTTEQRSARDGLANRQVTIR
ncbi:MAG: SEC-C domain-containing protein, partial [Nocardioidaceae bacterium]|nr:SEC-C domain-containing protein [Nocardioidaceae bacterium]